MSQPRIYSIIDKAVFDYHMIEDGDRILVGASGGKDSTALIQYFANRMRRKDCNFTFTALHIENDFAPGSMSDELRELMKSWGVEVTDYFVDVKNRVKEGFKMSCYWCSQQRRNELVHYALREGYNKIALGHHLDDILETLLMNMLKKGELSTMPPRLNYEKYPLSLIRPLCYVDVQTIIEHAESQGYINTTCTCTYQDNSGRKDARARLEALTKGDRRAKEMLLASLKNINREYLP